MGATTTTDAKKKPGDARGNEAYWNIRARRTAAKINLAWWLEALAAPLVILGVVASAATLIIRSREGGISIALLAGVASATLVVLAIACGWRARRKFESTESTLVRIEASLGLHNALSTARVGLAPWPAPAAAGSTPPPSPGLRWQWQRLALPPAIAIATWVAALWIPISGSNASANRPAPPEPLAWSKLDAELDALMESAVVEETYIEETRERLDQLRARDTDQWYSHNTMEATDAIAQAHRNEARNLEDAIERAERALDNMRNADADALQQQFDEYQKALDEMANARMQPNDALRQQLEALDPENLNQLTPEELEQLQDQLCEANEALKDALENAGDLPPENDGPPGDPGGRHQPGNGENPEEDGEHDPDLLGERAENEPEGEAFTPLAARDLSKAAIGDLLETRTGGHDTTDVPAGHAQGGAIDATGSGGDRIWRESLDPAEQRTLRKFFE